MKELSQHSQVSGLKLGVFWIVSMGMFICQFSTPICGLIWMITMVYTPFFVGRQTVAFFNETNQPRVTYFRAYHYSLVVYVCAALILSIVFWAYLRYLDDGYLINKYIGALTDPEAMKSLKGMGYSDGQVQEMEAAVGQMADHLREARPIDLSVELLSCNVLAGGLLSFLSALYAYLVGKNR